MSGHFASFGVPGPGGMKLDISVSNKLLGREQEVFNIIDETVVTE